jgi:hypothetical protein
MGAVVVIFRCDRGGDGAEPVDEVSQVKKVEQMPTAAAETHSARMTGESVLADSLAAAAARL